MVAFGVYKIVWLLLCWIVFSLIELKIEIVPFLIRRFRWDGVFRKFLLLAAARVLIVRKLLALYFLGLVLQVHERLLLITFILLRSSDRDLLFARLWSQTRGFNHVRVHGDVLWDPIRIFNRCLITDPSRNNSRDIRLRILLMGLGAGDFGLRARV